MKVLVRENHEAFPEPEEEETAAAGVYLLDDDGAVRVSVTTTVPLSGGEVQARIHVEGGLELGTAWVPPSAAHEWAEKAAAYLKGLCL